MPHGRLERTTTKTLSTKKNVSLSHLESCDDLQLQPGGIIEKLRLWLVGSAFHIQNALRFSYALYLISPKLMRFPLIRKNRSKIGLNSV